MIINNHTIELWIVVDVILLAAVTSLVVLFAKIRRAKRRLLEFRKMMFERIKYSQKLEKFLRSDDARSAAIKFFNELIGDLVLITGCNASSGLTAREIIYRARGKLPNSISKILERIYNIYEEVRFGGKEPSISQLNEMILLSRELEKELKFLLEGSS